MKILRLVVAISVVSGIIKGSQTEHFTTKTHSKAEVTHTKSTGNPTHPNEPKSGLTTKSEFNVDKLVAQAKELENKKNKINTITESSLDLIGQLERQYRDLLFKNQTKNKLSKQEIEDKVQELLVHEFDQLLNKLLSVNKELATRVINNSQEPSMSINFKE